MLPHSQQVHIGENACFYLPKQSFGVSKLFAEGMLAREKTSRTMSPHMTEPQTATGIAPAAAKNNVYGNRANQGLAQANITSIDS